MNFSEDINDLKKVKDDLIIKIKELDTLLASKNLTDKDGNRVKGPSYFAWRDRRLREKLEIEKKLKLVKEKIKELKQNDMEDITGINRNDDKSLLKALYKIFKQIIKEEKIELDKEEHILLNLIKSKFK